MDENSEPIPADVEDIKQHFGFLFEKGYEIYSAKNYPDAPWPIREVILRREGLLLKIYEERGELELSMGSASKEFLSLGNIIYFLSGGKERVGGFAGIEKYARPLRKYLDEIEFRFRNDYSNFEADIRSAEAKYTEAVGKSVTCPLYFIVYGLLLIVCYRFYNELVFDWWLSGFLAEMGYANSSWIIRGLSLLLAAGTVYIIRRGIGKSEDAVISVAEPNSQTSKRKSIIMAIIFFPLFLIAFALLIGAILSFVSWSDGFEIAYPIITWGLSLLLAVWIVFSIYRSNRG